MPRKSLPADHCIALIEERTFFRQCVLASLQAAQPEQEFRAFDSVDAWAASADAGATALLILWMPAPVSADSLIDEQLRQIRELPARPPVAVMSDHDGADSVAHVMSGGAQAFLPASMGLEMAVKVLDLVRAGGTFIPASTLATMAPAHAEPGPRAAELAKLFSPRQLAVIKAMRKGQPNKIIAYELAMCESTVKVHVRTIMRKLKARNRTEVAFLTRALDSDPATGAAA